MFSRTLGVSLAVLVLSACGGAKVVKEPQPVEVTTALAEAADAHLAARLDWVIVRNASTAWAKNADWDEYHLRVRNLSATPIELLDVSVFDSLGTRVQPLGTRKQLVTGSKSSARRYRDSGLKVKAGVGGTGLIIAGATATGAVGAAYLYAVGMAPGMGMSVSAAGAGLLVAGPAVFAIGIIRAVNNTKVNNRILALQSTLPLSIAGNAEQRLILFYPLAPAPGHIQVRYRDTQGEATLDIDTTQALAGLHLSASGTAAVIDPSTQGR